MAKGKTLANSYSTYHDADGTTDQWNATRYNDHFSFVWEYGSSLLDLLDPQPGERILDLGCGTGHLTAAIAERGADVIGIDVSPDMIRTAQQSYPGIDFRVGNATTFEIEQPVDAIFSNATLHWVKPPDAAVQAIHRALVPGGRLVAEFGGSRNVLSLRQAIGDALAEAGVEHPYDRSPWYFPGIAEYATLLEEHGFEPQSAMLFDRPTRLQPDDDGLRQWLAMFTDSFFAGVSEELRETVTTRIEEELRPTNVHDGAWYADYRRLRIVARRE